MYEDHGTSLRPTVAQQIRGNANADYPILGPNTTQEDWKEAQFVMQNPACTLLDLERERMKPEADRWKDLGRPASGEMHRGPGRHVESLTETATRLKEQLARSVDRASQQSGKGMLLAEAEKDTLYRECQENLKELFCNERVDAALMHDVGKCIEELVATVNGLTLEDGEREGGEGCLELLGHTASYSALVARKRSAM